MSTAMILDSLESDGDALATVKRIVDMMSRRRTAFGVAAACVSIWFDLRATIRTQRQWRSLISKLADLPLEGDNDLAMLRERAKGMGTLAADWGETYESWSTDTAPKLVEASVPFGARIGATIGRQMEEIACMYEDVAETLALAASEPFARLVETELAANRPECGRQREVG